MCCSQLPMSLMKRHIPQEWESVLSLVCCFQVPETLEESCFGARDCADIDRLQRNYEQDDFPDKRETAWAAFLARLHQDWAQITRNYKGLNRASQAIG